MNDRGSAPRTQPFLFAAAAVEAAAGGGRRTRSVRRQIHRRLGSDGKQKITSATPGLGIQPVQREGEELRRPPPPEKHTPAPKPPARSTHSSRAPPARNPPYPTVYTCRSRGSPTLPPPKRPAEGRNPTAQRRRRRWIGRDAQKVASLLCYSGGEGIRLCSNTHLCLGIFVWLCNCLVLL